MIHGIDNYAAAEKSKALHKWHVDPANFVAWGRAWHVCPCEPGRYACRQLPSLPELAQIQHCLQVVHVAVLEIQAGQRGA